MYRHLLPLLEKPAPYAKMTVPFWDDDHISEQMLRAHLDPDFEGASRKLPFIRKSVNWIRDLLPPSQYRQLMDIGCGPGIYAERFAAEGYQVTGIDLSRRSIAYARASVERKGLPIRYLCQNYLQMDLNTAFDLAVMIYCDYGVLSAGDRKNIMERVYRHLRPGGRFLFDVFTEAHCRQFEPSKTWEICENGGFWSKEAYLAFTSRSQYPDGVTLEHITVASDAGISTYYLWNTCFTREALAKEAAAAGFRVIEFFANVAGEAWSGEDQTMAVLLEK